MATKTSIELAESIRAESGSTVLLSFSAGKDAVATWLHLRPRFERIVPFYLELIPGLGFVERALAHYERFFGASIICVPNPSLFRMLKNMVYQPPERCRWIERARIRVPSYESLENHVRRVADAQDAYVAIGARVNDSLARRANLKRFGPVNRRRRSFQAIYDWSVADVDDAITQAGCGLSVDYEMFGRSFDGIGHLYLRPIRERYPDDYAKILEWFPLAELEFMRYEKCDSADAGARTERSAAERKAG